MRVALAMAAVLAIPITAAADDKGGAGGGSGGSGGGSTGGPGLPTAPAPTLPANPEPVGQPPGGAAPGETTPAAPAGDAPAVDPAYGDHDVKNFRAPRGKDVVITSYPERSKKNVYTLAGLAAGGAVIGAVGLYFHLDARSARDELSAAKFTGEPWTPDRQATYDRAHSSSVTAGVCYGIGGALLLASAVMFIATEPKAETTIIHPHSATATPIVAPTAGGALLGGAWRF